MKQTEFIKENSYYLMKHSKEKRFVIACNYIKKIHDANGAENIL